MCRNDMDHRAPVPRTAGWPRGSGTPPLREPRSARVQARRPEPQIQLATRLDPSAVSVSAELATYERGGVTFSAKMTLGNTWSFNGASFLDKLTRDVHSGAILCL